MAIDGLNLALLGMLRLGNHVVTTHLEHNSVLRPLNLLGIIGLSLALKNCLVGDWTQRFEGKMQLTRRLYKGLQEIPDVVLYGGAISADHVPLFSASIKNIHSEDLSAFLDGDFNISVRAGLQCAPLVHETLGIVKQGAVRFSPGHDTTQHDIDEVLAAMYHIAKHHS